MTFEKSLQILLLDQLKLGILDKNTEKSINSFLLNLFLSSMSHDT